MMRRHCLGLFVLTVTACHDSSEDCSLTDTCPTDVELLPPGGAGGEGGEGATGGDATGGGGAAGAGATGGDATGGAASGGEGAGGVATGGATSGGAAGSPPSGGATTAGAAGQGGQGGQAGAPAAGTSGEGGQGGAAGQGGQGGAPACDPLLLPDADACVVSEQLGVFADPTAPTGGDGSRAAPFASLTDALAAAGGKRVYACSTHGPFAESLVIDVEGAAVFGGFDCEGWSFEATSPTDVQGGATAITVAANDVALHDLVIYAGDGAEPGESSVALFARAVDGLALTRVGLFAGLGAEGAPGTPGSDPEVAFTFPDAALLVGGSGSSNYWLGGDGSDSLPGLGCPADRELPACPGGGSPGRGGDGGPLAKYGSPGEPGEPTDLPGGQGGAADTCGNNGTGGDGATPDDDRSGAGATELGSLDATGWHPAAGEDGLPGLPGQGGGGGGGWNDVGAGGGGACGGCGGAPALAGTNGGGSIALLAFRSSISLVACSLHTSTGGRGGAAAVGQDGQPGGLPGSAGGVACDGGNGGTGQRGGAAGAGAGGVSIGILHSGNAPLLDEPTSMELYIGVGGDPGAPIAGKPVTAAVPGLAEAILALP